MARSPLLPADYLRKGQWSRPRWRQTCFSVVTLTPSSFAAMDCGLQNNGSSCSSLRVRGLRKPVRFADCPSPALRRGNTLTASICSCRAVRRAACSRASPLHESIMKVEKWWNHSMCSKFFWPPFSVGNRLLFVPSSTISHGSEPLTRSKISEICQWQKCFSELKISNPRISCTLHGVRRSF